MLEVPSVNVEGPNFKADTYQRPPQQGPLPPMGKDTFELMQAKKQADSKDKWMKAGVIAAVACAGAFIFQAITGHAVGKAQKEALKEAAKASKAQAEYFARQGTEKTSKFNIGNLEFLNLKENTGIGDIRTTKTLNENVQKFFIDLLDNTKIEKKYLEAAGAKNAPLPNAYLLFGPPGAGKTEAVKMYAKASGGDLTVIKLGDFANSYVDGTATNMLDMFKALKKRAEENPDKELVILFDEIDGLARKLENISGNNEYLGKNRQSFITGLDMIRNLPNIKIFGTTNVTKKELDSAVISRLGNNATFEAPNVTQLREGLKFHLRDNTQIPNDFYAESNEALNEFLNDLAAKNGSYRDLATIVQGAIPKHAKAMQEKGTLLPFDIEYLKQALKDMGSLSGEIISAA